MSYIVAGVEYGSRYAYDLARARASGYASVRAFKADRHSERFLASLGARGRSTYNRVLDALSMARTKNLPLSDAAKRAGTSTATVSRYAGSAVIREGRTLRVANADVLVRPMKVLTTDGYDVVNVRSSEQASLISRHHHAIQKYQQSGNAADLQALAGKTVTIRGQKRELLTDTSEIDRLSRAGATHMPDIYERTLL